MRGRETNNEKERLQAFIQINGHICPKKNPLQCLWEILDRICRYGFTFAVRKLNFDNFKSLSRCNCNTYLVSVLDGSGYHKISLVGKRTTCQCAN